MRDKKNGQWISWGLIIFAFFVFAPLGAFLTLWKLFGRDREAGDPEPRLREEPNGTVDTRIYGSMGIGGSAGTGAAGGRSRTEEAVRQASKSPAPKKANTRWLWIVGSILLFFGVAFVDDIDSVGNLITALAFLAGGSGMFLKGYLMRKDIRRYGTILAMIGGREAVPVEELARKSGQSAKQVERDLRQMVENGYFGEGAYLNMELGYLFRSSAADLDWQEKQREKQRDSRASTPKEANEGYSGILRNIRRANDQIADPVLSAKIEQLESITARIFRAVEQDPEKEKRIDTFLNYYLPTTQKLLDSYAQFESAGVEGENLSQAKARISATMDMIIKGFSHQLDELYKADAMDVDSESRVLETMLRRETASAADDFGMAGRGTARSAVAEDFGLGRAVPNTGSAGGGTGTTGGASGTDGTFGSGSKTSGGSGNSGTSGTTGGGQKPRPKIGTSFEDDFGLGGTAVQRQPENE